MTTTTTTTSQVIRSTMTDSAPQDLVRGGHVSTPSVLVRHEVPLELHALETTEHISCCDRLENNREIIEDRLTIPTSDQLFAIKTGVQVGRMGCVPEYDGNGNSRNVSCSKPSLHCHKRPWEGALYKWLTRSASGAMHTALYK